MLQGKIRELVGFTLMELMIAITLGMIVIASVATTFTSQTRTYTAQENISAMEQNARGALDIMAREIKMAGYKPAGGTVNGIASLSSTSLTIEADIDGNGTVSTTNTANEKITYSYDGTNKKITRLVGTNTANTADLADNITAFSFTYYLGDSNSTTSTASQVRRVEISITAQTAKPDPGYYSNGGYRTVNLKTTVTPINLGL